MKSIASAQPPAREAPVFTRIALEQALRSGSCVICVAVHASERKSAHAFLYEGMMSPEVRQNFLRKGGFCRRHFWIARQIEEDSWQAGGVGLAILCEDLLRLANKIVEQADDVPRKNRLLIGRRAEPVAITLGAPCIFCEENATREAYLIEVLEELIGEPQFHRILTDQPLCVGHSQIALAKWKSADNRSSMSDALCSHVQRLTSQMRQFIEKHDHQRRSELHPAEQNILRYAIDVLVGLDHSAHPEKESL
jgi:Family of unknown function (DUF6062)